MSWLVSKMPPWTAFADVSSGAATRLLESPAGAFAFEPGDPAKVLETKNCGACDLSNRDFTGAALNDAYLVDVNFAGATLVGANLKNSYLRNGKLYTVIDDPPQAAH